jgi:glycerophosphoryl diester phosphodiesterase
VRREAVADGVPFLMHDATLERTSNGKGVAGELNLGCAGKAGRGRLAFPAFAAEGLASFERIARFCLDKGYFLNIEIKPTPGAESRTGTWWPTRRPGCGRGRRFRRC